MTVLKPGRVEKCAEVLLQICCHSSLWGLFRQPRNSEVISMKSSGLVLYGSPVIVSLWCAHRWYWCLLSDEKWKCDFQYFVSTAVLRLVEIFLPGMMSVSYRRTTGWYSHHQHLNKMPSFMPLYKHSSLVSPFSLSKITIMEKWFHQ